MLPLSETAMMMMMMMMMMTTMMTNGDDDDVAVYRVRVASRSTTIIGVRLVDVLTASPTGVVGGQYAAVFRWRDIRRRTRWRRFASASDDMRQLPSHRFTCLVSACMHCSVVNCHDCMALPYKLGRTTHCPIKIRPSVRLSVCLPCL